MVTIAAGRRLVLVDPGPDRLAVLVRVGRLFGLPVIEARRMVDSGPVVLAEGTGGSAMESLATEFQALGAHVRWEPVLL